MHCIRRPLEQAIPVPLNLPQQTIAKSIDRDAQNNTEICRAADLPEVGFTAVSVDDAAHVHAEVGGEERQGQEDDSDEGEGEDCFVLAVGDDCEFILLDRAELEELLV